MERSDFVICVDMDDTIENLCEAWVDYLNRRYGTSVKNSDLREWDVSTAFPTLSRDEIYGALSENALWDSVKPKKDAQRYLKRLIDDGYSVYICTNTSYHIAKYKFEAVLFKYFPYIERNHIIITANKDLVACDFLVDDYEYNLMGKNAKNKILFDAPHNRNFDESKYGIKRMRSWKKIYEEIVSEYEKRAEIDNIRG